MTDRSPVAGVILAAGLGRRFGGPKAGATLAGTTFLAHVAARAAEVGLDPVIAVVPAGTVAPDDLVAVVNPDPQRGLSSSLRLGITAVPEGHAALVLLVDQPTLERAVIDAVLAGRGRRPLVAASAEGRLAPPVLVEPQAFAHIAGLSGDIGLREVFAANPELVEAVAVPAHAPDVDTAADLARLEARLGS
ncbi:MAG TPA: nucleotidyltransferase family protein [Candidatus Limnocylindria bacterium]